jgi:hypothetical protein
LYRFTALQSGAWNGIAAKVAVLTPHGDNQEQVVDEPLDYPSAMTTAEVGAAALWTTLPQTQLRKRNHWTLVQCCKMPAPTQDSRDPLGLQAPF